MPQPIGEKSIIMVSTITFIVSQIYVIFLKLHNLKTAIIIYTTFIQQHKV